MGRLTSMVQLNDDPGVIKSAVVNLPEGKGET